MLDGVYWCRARWPTCLVTLAFRSRVSGVYLSIMTQALTYALMLAFFRNEMGFGGNNGLTDFKDIIGYSLQSDATKIGLFVCTGLALIVSYIVCRMVVTSRLGRVALAIRDTESRTRFMGYDVDGIKLWVFVLSAVIAGIAGACMYHKLGSSTQVNLRHLTPSKSWFGLPWAVVPLCSVRLLVRSLSTMPRAGLRSNSQRYGYSL